MRLWLLQFWDWTCQVIFILSNDGKWTGASNRMSSHIQTHFLFYASVWDWKEWSGFRSRGEQQDKNNKLFFITQTGISFQFSNILETSLWVFFFWSAGGGKKIQFSISQSFIKSHIELKMAHYKLQPIPSRGLTIVLIWMEKVNLTANTDWNTGGEHQLYCHLCIISNIPDTTNLWLCLWPDSL